MSWGLSGDVVGIVPTFLGLETKVASVPSVTPNNVQQVAVALKSLLDVREGLIGNPMDANVTFRDLVAAQVVKPAAGFSPSNRNVLPISPIDAFPDGYVPTNDFTIPPKPTGVEVTGGFAIVSIKWDDPKYRNHAYTEVWKSETNVLGNAVLVGTSDSQFFTDNLGTSANRYYWIRFVSQANVFGPYNDVGGVHGVTSTDPSVLMDLLADEYNSTSAAPFFQIDVPTEINGAMIPAGTYMKAAFIADATISNAMIQNAAIDNAKIVSLDVSKLANISSAVIGANIQSSNYVSGQTGWSIARTGLAEFNNVTVRGTVYANAGLIGGNAITSEYIASPNYISSGGAAGWAIGKTGDAYFNNAALRGSIKGGAFTEYAWPSTGTGFYLGPEGLLLGNPNTGKYFQVDSSGNLAANVIYAENIVSRSATSFEQPSLTLTDGVWTPYDFYMDHSGIVSAIGSFAWNASGTTASWYVGIGFSFFQSATSPDYIVSAEGNFSNTGIPNPPVLMDNTYLSTGWHRVFLKASISNNTGAHRGYISLFKSYR